MIRRAVTKILRDAVSKLPANDRPQVMEAQRSSLGRGEIPAICVYCDSETVLEDAPAYDLENQRRHLDLQVECFVRASEDYRCDDALDALTEFVEATLYQHPNLYIEVKRGSETTQEPLCAELSYLGVDKETALAKGDAVAAVGTMRYLVVYDYRPEGAAAALDDFLRASAEYDLGASQDTADRAKDNIVLPGPTP